jgi:hypothetical protein
MTSFKNTHPINIVVGLDLLEVIDAYCTRAKVSRGFFIRYVLTAFLRSPVADEALSLLELTGENE